MAEKIDGYHAVAAGCEVFRERPVHLLREQQPVDEDQRPGSGR